MKRYLLIGICGALGAISRFLVKGINISGYIGKIPLNTLIINVSGSLLLAFILTVAFEIWFFDEDIRLGIATGFLGAYTTFSTLCKETVGLVQQGLLFSAASYVTLSLAFGLAAAYLGVVLARTIVPKIFKMSDEPDKSYDGGVE